MIQNYARRVVMLLATVWAAAVSAGTVYYVDSAEGRARGAPVGQGAERQGKF